MTTNVHRTESLTLVETKLW